MNYVIVVDSGCDLANFPECENITFERAPLTIRVGDKVYIDDFNLDIDGFMDDILHCTTTTGSAAPSPGIWYEAYKKADIAFAITITSGLSGSYRSAMAAKDMILDEYPDKKIHVIDSLSAGPELTVILYKLTEYIKQEMSFEEITEKITAYKENTGLGFMLENLDNFVRNGRVNKYVGKLTGVLGIRIIGRASTTGELEVVHKSRGKYLEQLANMVINDGYKGGRLVIAHCYNETGANKLCALLKERFPDCSIEIMPTSGLCSYYAEYHGLLVGYEKV